MASTPRPTLLMEPPSAHQASRSPSWAQRLLALEATYLFIPTVAAIYAEWLSITCTGVTLRDLMDWECAAWLVAVILTSGPFGFVLGVFVASYPNRVMLHIANRLNRGPFMTGDQVQIISGEFAGTVTTVTGDFYPGISVTLDLGADAKKDFRDVFDHNKLMRAP